MVSNDFIPVSSFYSPDSHRNEVNTTGNREIKAMRQYIAFIQIIDAGLIPDAIETGKEIFISWHGLLLPVSLSK